MNLIKLLSTNYIILHILLLSINFFILSFREKIAIKLKINDIPNYRKIHKNPTPLIGGICFYISILILFFFNFYENNLEFNKFLICLILFSIFFFIGLLDDVKPISPKIRTIIVILSLLILLPFQKDFLISELRFFSSSKVISLHNFSLIFTLFCIFALYNAYNFIDGVNGSATSIIIFWIIFLFYKDNNIIYLSSILILLLIFFYNLSGKIFLGNSGTSLLSIFISLSIINDYNLNSKFYADEILFLLLFPGLDMCRVVIERILKRKKIYSPDKIHFHHYLIKNKIKNIWIFMLILSALPLLLILFLKKIILSAVLFVFIYFILMMYFKKND